MNISKYIIPVLVLPLLMSCGGEKTNPEEVNDASKTAKSIELTSSQFERGNMELGTFSNQPFNSVVKANGTLDVPPENKSTVSAYFGGYVKQLSLIQGQTIKAGQTLFTLESPEYIQVQQDFLEAKSELKYLKSDYDRQQDLSASNVSSQKTLYKAESDYKVTLARYESLKKRLQLMNINPNSVSEYSLRSTIAVAAPISGFVTNVMATKGLFLNPSDVALTIMNMDHMHIELNIFEHDLAKVAIGQEVSFRIQNSETPFKATVYLINKAIDPENRTIKVHCHFTTEKDALKMTPGMYVEAEIFITTTSSLALPKNAVITIEDKSYALLQKKDSKNKLTFERIEIKVGQSKDGFVQILNAEDFKNKPTFLVNGAFNLIQE